MPHYLGRFRYSTSAIKALVAQPQDREKAAAEVAKSLGAKLLSFWYALGEFDGVFLLDAPDNPTAVALAMALGASGGFTNVETTPLLSMDEAQDAMRIAQRARYEPPSNA